MNATAILAIRGAVIDIDTFAKTIVSTFGVKTWFKQFIGKQGYESLDSSWLGDTDADLVKRIFTDGDAEDLPYILMDEFLELTSLQVWNWPDESKLFRKKCILGVRGLTM